MKTMLLRCLLLIGLLGYFPLLLAEQELSSDNVENHVEIPPELANPRATVQTFINAMQAVAEGDKQQLSVASSTLDLSDVSMVIHREKGNELAYSLYSAIERSQKVNLKSIPTAPKTSQYVFAQYPQGKIEIVRLNDGRWLFSKTSLKVLPNILEGLITQPEQEGVHSLHSALPLYIQFRSYIPDVLKNGFLLEYWQWLSIFIVILIGSIADKVVAWFLAKNVSRWKQNHPAFNSMDSTILRPLGLMAMALIWWSLIGLLGLPNGALIVLSVAVKVLVSLSAVWSAFRLVDIVDALLVNKARGTDNKFDDLLVPMIIKSLKVFVLVLGVIFSADNLNIDVTSLLAGLGLGGLAFALAAKDLVGNFFGSLTVVLDRPFQIGDWVIIGDVEGSVEAVGFRSTRIRTFYNSLITLPNSILTNTKIDNMGARSYRRMKTMLGLTYDTPPEQIEAFCEGIRSLIQLHPYMRKDYYQVYFNQYNTASLDILVYVFWQTPDWNTELRERHRFLLDILRLAKQLGVEFAYPTQTLYLKQADQAPASAGQFSPEITQLDAFALGQREARSIVEATTGLDVRPDPVKFPN